MSQNSQSHIPQGEELNPAHEERTPLEQAQAVTEQQNQNRESVQPQADITPDVPGGGPPSDRRHHPQRQMYGSGTDES